MIDFRSDTLTLPTSAMKEAMMQAPLGDDVFGEDPTINELERYAAELFGMEAGLFCSSGTMTNQIAIKVHTQPGDEVICSRESHIYCYEGGGLAYNSGISARLIEGKSGIITAADVSANLNNPDDVHFPLTRLVSLENTSNRGGGLCYELDEIAAIKKVCDTQGLGLHLDGARIFNALVAKGQSPKQFGNLFDSISICLSKGLGAPVGSVLVGSTDFIKKSRRVRKVFGGGMRQAGIIAAGGLYALQNHVERLAEDHARAKYLGEAAAKNAKVSSIERIETNIVMINTHENAAIWVAELASKGLKCMALGPNRVRLVTHLNLSESDIIKATEILSQ